MTSQIAQLVDALATELPGITFGYLGNCGTFPGHGYHDDRSWYIFLPHPGRVGAPTDLVSIGRTENVATAHERWDALSAAVRVLYARGGRV